MAPGLREHDRREQDRREQLRRWAAPVALLLLLTVAAVLIHDGLSGRGSSTATPPPTVPATTATATRPRLRPSTAATATAPPTAQYYVVQSGDTFGAIATRYGTSVAQIESLNPGVSSTSLTVGQRIRVK